MITWWERFHIHYLSNEKERIIMKKLIACALASCMLLSGTVVFADETEAITSLNWEDFVAINEASDNDLISQGDFVTFDEIACKMWVPNVMKEVELTDEDKEAGYIGYYSTDDQDGVAAVMYVNMDGMELADYAKELEGMDDVENIEMMTLNGFDAVSYDLPEKDTTCVSLATEAGYILEFSFAPMSDEGFQTVIAFMGASIQPEDAEESTEAAS